MNAEMLLQHFERISEAPDAVARLRRFILDLAVRGKLVEQDTNDEPAGELLKRIQIEKARFEKKTKEFTSVTEDEAPFDVPAGWEWVRLGELGLTQTGTTPSKNLGEYFGKHIPFIKPGDLYADRVEYTNEGLSEDGLKNSGRIARAGSLLMVCIGTIGKCQLVDRDCSFNQQLNSLSPCGGISSNYLLTACLSDYFQKSAWAASARTTIAILNKGKWEQLMLPLPPLAEQHRIVSKVNELMALCDQLQAAQNEREARRDLLVTASFNQIQNPDELVPVFLDHLPRLTTCIEHVKQLRQMILELIFQGRLTNRLDEDGLGIDLVNEIYSKSETDESRKTSLRNLKLKCEPAFSAPITWGWIQLQFLCELIGDIDHKMPKAVSTGVPFLSAKDLKDSGELDFTDPKFISEEDFLRLSRKILPRRGDIIYSRIGARLGKARLVEVDTRFLISYSCCLIRPRYEFVEKRFLQIFLDSHLALRQAHSGVQSIGVPDLGLGEIKAYRIPMPPFAEQHRIVAKVDELMALCDKLEAQLTTTQTDSRRLLEAVLRDALVI